MVVIQTSHGDAFPVALQFPSHPAILPAVVSLQPKTTVGPQLALGSETIWRLQQRYQQGGANRPDGRNLTK